MAADNSKQTSAGFRVGLAVASIGIVTVSMVTNRIASDRTAVPHRP
jgi:hypothetical protein